MENFKKIAKITVYKDIDVTVYRSTRSKLRIAVANVPGPMVEGKISFATETTTDEGLPHALEHLICMGSERYPFKGFLDVIASRCFGSGAGAKTYQDRTLYTLKHVGSAGLIKTLPVLIDHLLSPLLTDSQYLTEVHHIDGNGADGGVVYSEMQMKESQMGRIVERKRKELFYHHGSSYASTSGGLLADIREKCSAKRIKNFHKQFYHLNNMFITVCGLINLENLFNVISEVEEPNIDLIPENFERPFSTRTLSIQPACEEVICPADDDRTGLVEISWLGSAGANVYRNRALLLLFDYLTDTSGAPLEGDFVQIDDPFCTSVSISLTEQTDCEIIASFEDVPIAKLHQIRNRFFSKTVADHLKIETFDIQRFSYMIDQEIRRFRLDLENSPHSFIIDSIIGHQLYGPSDEDAQERDLEERLQEQQILRKLQAEPVTFWHNLFTETFTKNCVCVIGKPSELAVDEMMEKERKRLDVQIQQLGNEGLAKKEQILNEALAKNEANQPTDQILNDLIVKDLENFCLIPVSSQVLKNWPVHTIWHETNSDFYEVNTLIDTQKIPSYLRKYLMLWADLMFQSDAFINNERLNYEEVAKQLVRDLVSFSISIGIAGLYTRFATLHFRVDGENYHKLAEWTRIFLKQLIPDRQRVLVCAKKLANTAEKYKHDQNEMTDFVSTSMIYDKYSNASMFDSLGNEKFHRSIILALESGKDKMVMQQLGNLNDYILSSLLNIHLVGNFNKLEENKKRGGDWTFLKNQEISTLQQCDPAYGQSWAGLGKVHAISVGVSESAFLLRKAKFEGGWTGTSTMATLLLSQYLCGSVRSAVQRTGLAYDASIFILPDSNTITLCLDSCSKLTKAYEKVHEAVFSVLDGELDETQFEAAKRSLVCELVGRQSTIKSTALSAILAIFRRINTEFTKELCAQVWHATREDVLTNGSIAIRNLFDADKSVTAIATNQNIIEKEVEWLFLKVRIMTLDDLQLKAD